MSEHPINDDDLMAVDERLRDDAAGWRIDPPADLHERTMSALAAAREEATSATAAGGAARWGDRAVSAPSGSIGRVSHGMALAAACLALLITTWAALVLQSPPAAVGLQGMDGGGDPGAIATAPGGAEPGPDVPVEVTPPTDPLADLLAAASLESEIAALETDARTISTMMTRQVRLIGGQGQQQ